MSKVTRRRYTPEFKAEAVALVEKQGYKISEALTLTETDPPDANETVPPDLR